MGAVVSSRWCSGILSSAEIKNEWRFTSSPPIRLRGVDRENFIFTLNYAPVYRLFVYLSILLLFLLVLAL